MRPARLLAFCICCFLLLPACSAPEREGEGASGGERFDGTKPAVRFSDEAGVLVKKRTISLSAPDGCRIHYTTDGSVPTQASPLYQGPIKLSRKGNRWVDPETSALMAARSDGKTLYPVRISSRLPGANVIRAVAVAPDGTSGDVVTKTYFVGTDLKKAFRDVMVISMVTDPDNLLDYEKGILASGKLFDEWASIPAAASVKENKEWWKVDANYMQKGKAWERLASLELFDASDTLTVRQDCGIRLKGSVSRMYPQKSWNISFKGEYGGSLDYPLFPDAVDANTGKVITRYQSFSLRNGGNETEYLKFKDSWIQSRVQDRDFSTQKSRIAVLFLNGEYWGHYNLIEKYDAKYVENHYGVADPLIIKEDQLDEGKESDFHLYEELVSFRDKDLSLDSDWEAFKQVMDVRSMADYFATEIYIANFDWRETKNTQLWRSTAVLPSNPYSDGRWRYMLFDTEFSSGLYGFEDTRPGSDTFAKAMKEHPLFAAAMGNPEFREMFKAAITEIARNNFEPRDVEEDLQAWAKRWKRYMPDYYARFGDTSWGWRPNLRATTLFFQRRSEYILPVLP